MNVLSELHCVLLCCNPLGVTEYFLSNHLTHPCTIYMYILYTCINIYMCTGDCDVIQVTCTCRGSSRRGGNTRAFSNAAVVVCNCDQDAVQ